MKKLSLKIYPIIIGLFLLSGCGFKLRTMQSLPPQLHQIYYQTDNPYGQFEITIKRSLKASNIILLPNSNATAPILHITANYSYSTTSPISTSEARVYTLNYSATISINSTTNALLLTPQTVSTSRSITLQANEPIESSSQIEIAKQEMIQELSVKVLNVLCAEKTFEALAIKK